MTGTDQEKDAPGKQGTTSGAPPPTGATGGTTKQGTLGGTRPKDTKAAPPPPSPQVLQLTPELFQQTVAAAVTAALTAAQQQQHTPVQLAQADAQAPIIPRKEKKLAEFWTSRPIMWFRLFDGQFPAALTEDARFNALLNHLPSAALPFVDHILRAPGQTPFTRAKACLVKHYEVSPRDRARTLRTLTSLGDKTPTEMLHYMRSLLPGVPDNPLFEAIFIDLLPANARDAAVKHDALEDMAEAADKVMAESPVTPVVSAAVWTSDDGVDLAQVGRSSAARPRDPTLCYIHQRYGKSAFKCAFPRTCRMRDAVTKSNASPANANAPSASGKAPAGRQ